MASLKDDVADKGKNVAESVSDSAGGFDVNEIWKIVLAKFVQVVEAVLILLATYFLILWIKSYFQKLETTHEQQKTALNLVEKIVNGFVFVMGLTLALKSVGLDISLLVSVGLLGLSYGLKDAIKNYIAGILIFFKAPFKIGDIVKIKNFVGKVEKMEFQSTSLKTFDNRDVTIYNSDIMTQSIENYSRYPMRRMEIDVKLGYGSDMQKTMRIFDTILANNNMVLKNPKYSIVFKNFADTSVIVQLKFWVSFPSNMQKIRSQIALQISQAFDEENIMTPATREISNFEKNEKWKVKVQQFYTQPSLASILQNDTAITVENMQLEPELIDADEPTE